jgi:hypothetical protein
MKWPEEDEKNKDQGNAQDPADEIETVSSKNDNMEPIPDSEQLEQKKS